MEFDELIRNRYSVRAYKSDPIDDEMLVKILEAGRFAPTAANLQPIQVIIIHTQDRESELKQIYSRDWFTRAPLILFVCGIPSQAWIRRDGASYLLVDAAIVMDHMILEATNLGLGTCWIAAFDAVAARKVLALPEGVEPLICSPLGFPDDQIGIKERKSIQELVRYEKW
jgi:nitroreductase